tara:strand:- start:1462 stop:1974 length:513 start_codon:yes stop_codon:yes gene_type:complete
MNYKVLKSRKQIDKRVKELACSIDSFYKESSPLMICILKGSILFFSDLIRNLNINFDIDFIGVKSYVNNKSIGTVEMYCQGTANFKDRDIVIVEDIIDSGKTINTLISYFSKFSPNSIKVVTLLNKPSNHKLNEQIDWIGFNIKDRFVFGYGLDFNQKYRGLKDLVVVNE